MLSTPFYSNNPNLSEKILSVDYVLVFLVLILGVISFFAMYSTEQGHFGYYTQSHLYRFCVFFIFFLIIGLFNIKIWFKSAYIFYFLALILLFGVDFFGIVASGSKRWINLFVLNLQPSELMKVALIIFLARYYNKIPTHEVNNIRYMIVPFFSLFIPVTLVIKQPDLGTAMLIAFGGLAVIWLTGFKMKYFIFSSVIFTCLMPVIIAFLKPYQKSRILTFINPERDPLGAGYQIIQSKIAVGSGGILGKGYFKGSQR